ncbi:MAG: carboxypeptidase-like regulatory domain-containing protein, partial [Acidobacteriota bacterium]
GSCTRTRRLSEAGDDLAYLFFYKQQPEPSARLEAFATTDGSNQFDFDRLHDPEIIQSPVPGVIVELRSDSLTRFAQSDRNGRSVFDGLPEGDYRVTAFAAGYPFRSRLIAGPQPVHIEKQGCARQFLLLPKTIDSRQE